MNYTYIPSIFIYIVARISNARIWKLHIWRWLNFFRCGKM